MLPIWLGVSTRCYCHRRPLLTCAHRFGILDAQNTHAITTFRNFFRQGNYRTNSAYIRQFWYGKIFYCMFGFICRLAENYERGNSFLILPAKHSKLMHTPIESPPVYRGNQGRRSTSVLLIGITANLHSSEFVFPANPFPASARVRTLSMPHPLTPVHTFEIAYAA